MKMTKLNLFLFLFINIFSFLKSDEVESQDSPHITYNTEATRDEKSKN